MTFLHKVYFLFSIRERWQAIGVLLLMIAGAVLETVGVGLIFPLISLLVNPEKVQKHEYYSMVYNFLGCTSYQGFLIWFCVLLIAVYLFKNVFLFWVSYVQNAFCFNCQTAWAQKLLKTYLTNSYSFHLQKNSAELMNNIVNNVASAISALVLLFNVFISGAVFLSVFVLILLADPVFALIAFGLFGGLTVLFIRSIRKGAADYAARQNRCGAEMIKWINQGLGSVKETKVMGRESYFIGMYKQQTEQYKKLMLYRHVLSSLPRYFVEVLALAGLVALIVAQLVSKQDFQAVVPMLALYAAAVFRLMPTLTLMMSSLASLKFHTPAMDFIYDDLLKPAEAWSAEVTDKLLAQRDNAQELKGTAGFLTLQDIWFRYDDSDEWVLSGISIDIPKGASTAITGSSGAGKSTLANIILGLLFPAKGAVFFDEHNIYEDLRRWQDKLGYVPQSIYLSDDSILCNVAFGIPKQEIDSNQVWKALHSAKLDEYVKQLPEGLDTIVGENGVRLSGGQRQRLGIARALYHDPEVLVMDEATSNLDNDTEIAIADAMEELTGEKTLLIIAHRTATRNRCQYVYNIENGKAVREQVETDTRTEA